MARELVETLDIAPDDVIATGAELAVYNLSDNAQFPTGLLGGTLGDHDSLRLTAQCLVTFDSISSVVTVKLKFGSSLVAIATFSIINTPIANAPLVLEAMLSADGSASLQVANLVGSLGVAIANWGGTPVGAATGTEDSSSDVDLSMTFQVANGGSITKQQVILEKISFIEDPAVSPPSLPNTQILTISKLNELPHSLIRYVSFYAELLYSLDMMGVGVITFTRASSSTAVWRDGVSHTVGNNIPRYSYNGAVPRGILLDTGGGEALSFHIANALNDGNDLYWIQTGVIKKSPGDANPINGSGLWVTASGIYISHILKFRKNLSVAEDAMVRAVLSSQGYD